MGLRDLHAKLSAGESEGRLCKVGELVGKLPSEDAEWLAGVLVDPNESGASIRRTLMCAGWSVAESTVNRHRRGECACAAK